MWFYSDHRAIRYTQGIWTAYAASDGFLETVNRLFKTSDGAIWFGGTHKGASALARFDGTWEIHTKRDGMIDEVRPDRLNEMAVCEAGDGALWVGGRHDGRAAVCRYGPVQSAGVGTTGSPEWSWMRYTHADGLDGDWITHVYETSDGSLWFGSRTSETGVTQDDGSGLYRFDPGSDAWTRFTEPDSLFSTFVTGICEGPLGVLWVATVAGIGRLDLSGGDRGWWHKVDFQVQRPKPHSLTPTNDGLWFAFARPRSAGVVHYDGNTWKTYTERDGLGSDAVSRIHEASDGALWFLHQKGFARFSEGVWADHSQDYESATGSMPPSGLAETKDGSFWITGERGRPLSTQSQCDRTGHLRGIARGPRLLGWERADRDLWNDTPSTDLRFQFRLDETPWSPTGSRNAYTFTSLSSGPHRFEVRAIDRDGHADATPAVHAFVVEPPWWRNPTVAGPGILLVVVVLFQSARIVQAK